MFEVPAYFPLLSLHLSRVLDEVGLNELTVRTKRCYHLQREQTDYVDVQLNVAGKQQEVYCFGSQSEGTTTEGLLSDVDELLCSMTKKAIQEDSEREDGKHTVLMLSEKTPPGYVKLQLYFNKSWRKYGFSLKHCDVLRSEIPKYTGSKIKTHRTGISFKPPNGLVDNDRVEGIKCNSWPVQAHNWLTKGRPGHWPSQKMLRFAEMSGCFLVPVGHRLSSPEKQDYEFRISPSLTERCLMFSFNMTQIKCYVMLKIISKLYLKPATLDGISSFHLKNVMFYLIENSHPKMWKEKYLVQCITTGLFVLLEFVINGFLPNYIIPGENLFAGRITAVEQMKLVVILKLLIKSNGYFLFKIETDGIDQILRGKCDHLPSKISVTADIYTRVKTTVHSQLQTEFLQLISNNVRMLSKQPYEYGTSAGAVCVSLHNALRIIRRLRNSFITATYSLQKSIIYLTPMYCSYLGTLMSSISICHNRNVPIEAMYFFELGTHSDVASSQLKLASAYFCSEEFNKAATILTVQINQYKSSSIQPVCGCWFEAMRLSQAYKENIFAKRQASNKLVTHCVMFSRQEFYCVPLPLQYEMFKSEGEYYDTYEDAFLDMAMVDSLPYLLFLQFITYKQLGEDEKKNCTLNLLTDCCEKNLMHHEMTAWNLLGHCKELERRPDEAICCYKESLRIRPRNNVARWLICLVLFKASGL